MDIANGTHKYVQIELSLATAEAGSSGLVTKTIVRSYRGLKYHAENYRVAMQRTLAKLAAAVTRPQRRAATASPLVTTSGGEGGGSSVLRRLNGRVIGGGRITCDHERKTVSVFGYSRTFGRAPGCNKRTAGLISTHLQYEVSWTEDGY